MTQRFRAKSRQFATYCAIHFGITVTTCYADKVSSMRKESGKSETGPIKDCSGTVDNFTDGVRLEKVDRLKKSLAENTYHVSSEDLAQKIIDQISDSPSQGEQES
jgi:anti-sigma28 factor (negative regulator of flagellin synthesis)